MEFLTTEQEHFFQQYLIFVTLLVQMHHGDKLHRQVFLNPSEQLLSQCLEQAMTVSFHVI